MIINKCKTHEVRPTHSAYEMRTHGAYGAGAFVIASNVKCATLECINMNEIKLIQSRCDDAII